jgi:hypothetical protein
MKVVNVRSPFVIQINEATQLGSKIELFIWNAGSSEPATPTYILSKPIPTTAQRLTSYNVSNFVKEYIENIAPVYTNYVGNPEQNNEWCVFRIKRYYLNSSSVYVLLTDAYYYGVNGFTNYMDGIQNPSEVKILLLANPNINNYYYKQSTYPNDLMQYFNLIVDKPTTTTTIVDIRYERIDGVAYSLTASFGVGFAGVFNTKIPISIVKVLDLFINGCKVTITYTPATGSPIILPSFYTYPICEVKYTPVLCDFINRFGGWQTITFFKAQTNNLSVKNEDYKLSPNEVDYNPLRGQNKSFNFIGTQVLKANTGWVDENYKELITDLLLSEKVLIDKKPVIVKTQATELKTKLKNRLINYELEFEYSYNLINDVI